MDENRASEGAASVTVRRCQILPESFSSHTHDELVGFRLCKCSSLRKISAQHYPPTVVLVLLLFNFNISNFASGVSEIFFSRYKSP